MAEKIRLKISPKVAAFVQADVGIDEKLKGLEAAAGMATCDRVLLLFCLMRDRVEVVREAATVAFSVLPEEPLADYIMQQDPHPAVLDVIARLHSANSMVVAALLENGALSTQARMFLQKIAKLNEPPLGLEVKDDGSPEALDECVAMDEANSDQGEEVLAEDGSCDETPAEMEEEGEEFLSKFKIAQMMGIAEKIKMALSGDKEWRSILIKDSNKLVSASVIKNPRITEAEILSLIKAGVQNDEIMRLICANKEWIKNYLIRKALVENPRTPIPNALRYLATLGEKDVAGYAKSKNISSVISTQAKRMLLNKKR